MFLDKISELKDKGLYREIHDRTSPQGTRVKIDGKEYINFSSNDYLGLANNPYIINKVKEALDSYGYGSGASRLLNGGSKLHKDLEHKIAQFKNTERAIVFNSGYAANTGIIPAITDSEYIIFSDELNHASVIDGCRLSRARTLIYKHKSVSKLESLIRKEDAKKKIVVTDTIFSMDGDIAPITDIYEICKKNNALLYLDDAHGTGVLGNGRGALSHFGIPWEPWIIQMGTFSKALGSFGSFVAGSKDVIDWITNNARSLIFSTALPSCIVAASLASLELIENDSSLINRLWDNREKVVNYIKEEGFGIFKSETPIIPLKTGTIENTMHVSKYLYNNGIIALPIRPPTVNEPRIRITVSAAHSDEDFKMLIEILRKVKGWLGG
jgi:8-amino-7-oxononanoate synthase